MISGSERGRSEGPWSELVMPEDVGRRRGNAMPPYFRRAASTLRINSSITRLCVNGMTRNCAYLLRRRPSRAAVAKPAVDVVDHHLFEIRRDRGAAQGHRLLAVDEDGRGRALAGARQRDADVGVLALARPVDDAAHHRDVERLDTRIALLPLRHRLMDETLDIA